jgi:soluble P-type ATPase
MLAKERMPLWVDIPGRERLELEHLVLDVNGTLTNRGAVIEGVSERLADLGEKLRIHLLSADTFGTLDEVAAAVGGEATTIASGEDKRRALEELGAHCCVAIGNGTNDAAMLELAALGIAVIGPEGTAGAAVRAADVVCGSTLDALDLLLDETALRATLRL